MKKLFNKPKTTVFEKQKRQDDPRLKNIIKTYGGGRGFDVGIVGVPFDGGVEVSGGRVGSALAPDVIREQLKKYGIACNSEKNADISLLKITDFGNVAIKKKNSELSYGDISTAVREVLEKSDTAIVIGGGHDVSCATIRALSEMRAQKIGGMNIGAHFDARPVEGEKISSGNPFRILLEKKLFAGKNFYEIASQGQVNSKANREWLENNGVHIYFLSDVRNFGIKSIFKRVSETSENLEAFFASIDMDSVAQAFAPGSSAPSPDGLSPKDILTAAYLCGKNPKIKLFEIMELNPKYDIDNRTSRLAANIILEFLAGFCVRKKKSYRTQI